MGIQSSASEGCSKYIRAFILAVPSESFVFSVCYAAPSANTSSTAICGTIFTADDSGELCVFDVHADKAQNGMIMPVQRIRHPKTLWSVAVIKTAMEACAVATACADGVVRVFSTNTAAHLPSAQQQASLN